MAVATFDTLKFANTLKAAGMSPQQAEAQAQAFAEVVQVNLSGLATREDVAGVRAELERAVKELRAEIDRAAKQSRADLDQAVKELRAEIKQEVTRLEGKIDTILTKLSGDMNLLRWMFGAVFAANLTAIGILLRLLFAK